MLTFKSTTSIKDVPSSWVYEFYEGVRLNGDSIRTKSFINNDSTPSLFIYPKDGVYKWMDFSSGNGGDYIDFVKAKKGLSFHAACKQILIDYNEFIKSNANYSPQKLSTESYKLDCLYEKRKWNNLDKEFWYDKYFIKSKFLLRYNVSPLEWFKLSKVYDSHRVDYKPTYRDRLYGFFNNKGELYKIYQPDYRSMKFVKLSPYIQGFDQLEFQSDTLIIGSSLKDIIVAETFELEFETIAPPSENTLLSKDIIDFLKTKYKFIFTLFDNDKAGIKAMLKYKETYGIDYIYIPYEKDLSDFQEKSGPKIVKDELIIRINKKLNGK